MAKGDGFFVPDIVEEKESALEIKTKLAIFADLWAWMEKRINRVNTLKGWTQKETRDGEYIALIHSELSEALEALRKGNNSSKKLKGKVSHAEEELADAVIRLMDMAYKRKWNLPKAIALKIEYNKTRPYRHGGKLF